MSRQPSFCVWSHMVVFSVLGEIWDCEQRRLYNLHRGIKCSQTLWKALLLHVRELTLRNTAMNLKYGLSNSPCCSDHNFSETFIIYF